MSRFNNCAVFLIFLGLSVIIAIISSVGYIFYSQPVKVSLACNQDEFKCTENGKCIPKIFHCDGDIDCPYKSDELNCPIEVHSYYEPHPDYETNFPEDHEQSDGNPNERAPKLQVVQNHYVLLQGTDFEHFCELIDGSSVQFFWSKRDDELSNNVNIHGPVLKISQISPEDQGVYICRAENNLGNDQIEIFIEVEIREAPILDIQPTKQTIKTGESARFFCKITAGHPTPTITWKFRNNNELSPNIVILPTHPGVITINSATLNDSGEYECYAENIVGSFSVTTKVEVLE